MRKMNKMISLKLGDIVRKLLSEDVSSDEVLDSIRKKIYVRINYDDGIADNGGNSKGTRVIQPMAVGTTKKGYPVVRAFQVSGNSRRGAPRWKFFRLDRITSWRPMKNKRFFTTPDGKYGEYNRNGDRSMSTFIDNAKFDDMSDPLNRVKAERQQSLNAPKVSTKNVQGPIFANQQWKKNVFTSQPNSKKYSQFARNVDKTSDKDDSYWDEYDKALQQLDVQNQEVGNQQPQSGPIRNSNDEDFYDIDDVDFDENNFISNKNRR